MNISFGEYIAEEKTLIADLRERADRMERDAVRLRREADERERLLEQKRQAVG